MKDWSIKLKMWASSGHSVTEISDLTKRAAEEIRRGVETAHQMGSFIDNIASGSTETEHMVVSIASAMEQQAAAIEEIRSSAEEVTATMIELSRLCDQTRAEVERFRFAA